MNRMERTAGLFALKPKKTFRDADVVAALARRDRMMEEWFYRTAICFLRREILSAIIAMHSEFVGFPFTLLTV